jgi:hypothetical protein
MSSPKLLKRPIAGSVAANGRLQTPAPVQDWLKAKDTETGSREIGTCTGHIEGNCESYEEDKKRRLGDGAVLPNCINYKKFAWA